MFTEVRKHFFFSYFQTVYTFKKHKKTVFKRITVLLIYKLKFIIYYVYK